MGKKIDELSEKINQAIDEVRDDIKSPETKEKIHKFANDTGEFVGRATTAVGSTVNSIIDDLNKGFEKGRNK
ncbi:MAG: hypothetical protein K2K41_02425 [Ruminiclostridium sp.]|nr:hypothetical protein [Ruminiclostridium sp.]